MKLFNLVNRRLNIKELFFSRITRLLVGLACLFAGSEGLTFLGYLNTKEVSLINLVWLSFSAVLLSYLYLNYFLKKRIIINRNSYLLKQKGVNCKILHLSEDDIKSLEYKFPPQHGQQSFCEYAFLEIGVKDIGLFEIGFKRQITFTEIIKYNAVDILIANQTDNFSIYPYLILRADDDFDLTEVPGIIYNALNYCLYGREVLAVPIVLEVEQGIITANGEIIKSFFTEKDILKNLYEPKNSSAV